MNMEKKRKRLETKEIIWYSISDCITVGSCGYLPVCRAVGQEQSSDAASSVRA